MFSTYVCMWDNSSDPNEDEDVHITESATRSISFLYPNGKR